MRLFLFAVVSSMIAPSVSMALPKYETTKPPLPVSQAMDPNDKSEIDFVISQIYHQDHADPNQYYYKPKFRAVEYEEGAASYVKNEEVVASYSGLKAISEQRYQLAVSEVDASTQSVAALQMAIANAVSTNYPNLAMYQEMLKAADIRKAEADKRADAYEKLMPAGIIKAMNIRAADLLSFVGFPTDFTEDSVGETARRAIMMQTIELGKASGGIFTSNIASGFTDKEVASLRNYKTKYQPSVKLSVMPMESFVFESMTELQFGATGKKNIPQKSLMFNDMQGGGSFNGASINFDLSTLGAVALARNVGPFILPVRIRGALKQQQPPFHAKLVCDFTNGWSLKGRADVRDGLVIYNNDVTMKMDATDTDTGGCKLQLISGDLNSAKYKAFQTLEEELLKMKSDRAKLAAADKKAYWESVQKDVQANRHTSGNSGYSNVFAAYATSGWVGAAVSVLSSSAQFYWHTNIQDVSMMSKFKLDKELEENGYETVEMPLDMEVCYVYNKKISAYRTCNPKEAADAIPLTDATRQAEKSAMCAGTPNANECGKKRQTLAPATPEGNVINNPDV